ncbi:glycosyltransferase [Sulfitobacter sp. M57]|uniref:glycosyltransferase n=1 Tax=unclassified Sulfitobacter TaxID=196795 RepID=UPI0023E22515|nr:MULTISPECIES: glycosyltransferase [unclassified Sulfitobacter]MDF3415048.1 glycosyltransferase [Sulfitobacter sp. KE5]MDF3422529.1 glycosyltransferase [Sulfitobacter sp. KE43]MDF3433594.1 glycosyltransferase [Sulfitobacter sp. KE42]MDF3459234.1 glycosyltransferase [Sulfitobacter sp. S74]MDF3463133.1 glycosyltransferase [Sulfitobacter sp. Ks18]
MTNTAFSYSPAPRVTILMGIRNGADHLAAQLHSISQQSHANWHLMCSDDGSTDASAQILDEFAQNHPGQVTIKCGPCSGFSDNFMSLIRALPVDAGYVSFADQDDIWMPDKLARALAQLAQQGPRAALYCARQSYWYPRTNRQRFSPRMLRPFTLRNALIENVATGNTILLNPAAAALAQMAAHHTDKVFAHDWWLYLLMTATGGTVLFDNSLPQILYRQHGQNVIGAGHGMLPQMQRKAGVLRGFFAQRIEKNLQALRAIEGFLTPQARETCRRFSAARHAPPLARLFALRAIAPYRQHRTATLGFWGAASLGRI